QRNVIAKVSVFIYGWYWEVPLHRPVAVSKVAAFNLGGVIPIGFIRVDGHKGPVGKVRFEPHIIENIELRFGSKYRRVGNTSGGYVVFCPLSDRSWITDVCFAGTRRQNGKGHAQRLVLPKRVDECRADVRNQLKV